MPSPSQRNGQLEHGRLVTDMALVFLRQLSDLPLRLRRHELQCVLVVYVLNLMLELWQTITEA